MTGYFTRPSVLCIVTSIFDVFQTTICDMSTEKNAYLYIYAILTTTQNLVLVCNLLCWGGKNLRKVE